MRQKQNSTAASSATLSDSHTAASPSRRSFIKGAAILSMAGLALPSWMPRMAFASPENANERDILVCLFLRGGMDGLSAVVPYTEANYHDLRPTIGVPDGRVLNLDGQFGLHPSMASLMGIWQQQDLAIVHAAGSPDPTRSHFDAMDYMERGTPGEKSLATGWVGRHLQTTASQDDSPFRAVGMGNMLQTSLRGSSAMAMKSIADFHLKGREVEAVQAQLALQSLYNLGGGEPIYTTLGEEGNKTFEALSLLESSNPLQYTPQHGAVYGEDPLGFGLSQVAQLIRAQVGLEVACLDKGGWDTHNQMGTYDNGEMAGLLGNLAANLNAFYTDMQDEMGRITVVVMSEFGRRVKENGNRGADHGHGNCMFLMGGNLNGGLVHGQWPGLDDAQLDRGDLAITTDFRDVLAEVVQARLNNGALDQLFPGYTPSFLGVTNAGIQIQPTARGAEVLPELNEKFFLPMVSN